MKAIPLLTLLVVFGATARAHDMYIMPASFFPGKGATITVGFHVGDSFPDSEVSGRLERLRDPKLIWRDGSGQFRNLRVDGKRDVGDAVGGGGGELIATVNTAPALIELDAAKFTKYLKHEGLTEIVEWRAQHGESAKSGKERYSKYAKGLLLASTTDGFATQAVGYVIEIVPEVSPYTLKPGDQLPIQVLFRGKPAAGLQIESAWASKTGRNTKLAGRTGSDGRLKVPLSAAGLWRIHTIKMERCTEPAVADWESFWASLTFEVR